MDFTKTAQSVCQTMGALAFLSAIFSVQAQFLPHKDLSAMVAISIVQAAITTCKANGYNVSATVVGRNGEILALARGDNTGPTP